MKRKQSLMCIVLAVFLIASLVAGCQSPAESTDSGMDTESTSQSSAAPSNGGTSNGTGSETGSQATTTKAGSTKSGSSGTTENFNATGYPIVKKSITLTFFVPKHPLHSDYAKMRLFTEMEKKTNIKIQFIQVPTESYTERRALAWNSRTLPDGFFLWNDVDEQITYGKAGLILPIEKYIDQYAPNYKNAMKLYPEMKKLTTMSDGHIYSTAIINDVPRDMTFKQFINKNWLDTLKLSMPKTTDELYNVLKAFKTKDPNRNGLPDEIPLSTVSLYQTRNFLMSAFGYVSTGIEVGANNKVVYVPTTDNYRAYLEYARKLYAEGLLDNSTFMMKDQDLAAKGNQGIVGCFDGAAAYLVTGEKQDANYTAVPPLTSSINSKKMWLSFDVIWPTGFIMTKSNKYPRETIRWLDYLYSDEAKSLQAFGKEGTDWSWEDSAHTSWVANTPSGVNPEQYRGTLTPAVGIGSIAWWSKDFVLKENNPLTKRINEAVNQAGYMNYLKKPYPQVVFTSAENKTNGTISADLDAYMQRVEVNFITGKTELNDTNWKSHLNTLKKMDVDQYVKIHQDAYNRYLKQ